MKGNRNIHVTVIILLSTFWLAGCDSTGSSQQPPSIKMGDPSTIVTETDSQYLQDFVVDLKLADRPVQTVQEQPEESPQQPQADTTTTVAHQPEPAQPTATPGEPTRADLLAKKGLKVPFPQVQLFIPNIDTRTYQKFNFETAYGASYELTEGKLDGNHIVIGSKGTISAVYMRYQTIIVARNKLGMLPLETLRKTTEWEKIKGDKGVYKIDLPDNKLERIKVSNKAIRNAVTRATRDRNWTANGRRQWLNAVKRVNSTNQKPLGPELRAVMWKVVGKDENGRPFQRQLRMDIPIKT
ncbi:MAG: hypothetical protein H6551_08950 [Chitinophagales bacterium]|nr:hypothetical protein [Chitinophagaceae bacterium]MCB9065249.1 hypothetical protein [Chitinophagales bacterium]